MTPEHKAKMRAGREAAKKAGKKRRSKREPAPPAFSIDEKGAATLDGGTWAVPLDAATTERFYVFLHRWFASAPAPAAAP